MHQECHSGVSESHFGALKISSQTISLLGLFMKLVCHSFKSPHSVDDAVATSKLFISQICGAEEGLFPTFGPCFINFYGAPREFETIALGENNLDHLNMGKGVG